MPWSIRDDHPDCSGYAVVQDSNGHVAGCHTTREAAQRQIAALYASEADKEKQMTRLNKTYEVESFKALPGDDNAGRFEAIVSVFGNVDYQGDRVMEGAFKGSIERWQEKGDPIPVIWSHDWANPHAHIGYVDPSSVEEAISDGKGRNKTSGLKVSGQLDLDNPFAAQVYRLLKERRVKEFSFAYDVIRESPGRDKANELHELDIIEVGPTLKGANPSTELLNVKSQLEDAAAKAEEAGFDVTGLVTERILQKAKTSMGARNYDTPEIDPDWADIVQSVAGEKSRDEEAEEEVEAGDTEAAIEESFKDKPKVTVEDVTDEERAEVMDQSKDEVWIEDFKDAMSDVLDKFVDELVKRAKDPNVNVVGMEELAQKADGEIIVTDSDEPVTSKEDPDAELKARIADLEAITGLSRGDS